MDNELSDNFKSVFDWLQIAGVEKGNGSYPDSSVFKRWFQMALEENWEAVESNDAVVYDECLGILEAFLSKAKDKRAEDRVKSLPKLKDAIIDSAIVNFNLVYFIGIKDYNALFNKVMDSNFSKFCDTEEEALLSTYAYEKGTHPQALGRVIYADYREVGDLFVLFDTSNGKLLKSLKFKEPKL
jgi:hypothetical protein